MKTLFFAVSELAILGWLATTPVAAQRGRNAPGLDRQERAIGHELNSYTSPR